MRGPHKNEPDKGAYRRAEFRRDRGGTRLLGNRDEMDRAIPSLERAIRQNGTFPASGTALWRYCIVLPFG